MSDYEVISRQQAKKIISSPTKLREESSKQNSLLELRELEKTGLKCTLIHVGPRLLDQYAVKIIFQYLSDYPDAYISEKKPGTYGIFSNGREVDLGFENEYFYLYLACIRYLAREGKIK